MYTTTTAAAQVLNDAAKETQAAVFRIPDITDEHLRYKVDINAQKWLLTGEALTHSLSHSVTHSDTHSL